MYVTWLGLFRLGYSIGLLPEQILDMTLDVVEALVDGYSDRLIDLQSIAAQTGYWAGYYQSKRPKKIKDVVNSILKSKEYKHTKQQKTATTEDDVQKFQERELRRMATFNQWEAQNG